MIQRNPYGGKPRTIDNKQVYALLSSCVMERATGKIFDEVPEGASASDYVGLSTSGSRLRCDQTGQMYEVAAHELEDTTRTYTEVFPDPRDLSEIVIVSGSSPYARFNKNLYPDYVSSKTYAKGDRVVALGVVGKSGVYYTFESDFDDNIGNTPNVYGWSVIDYGVEVNENIHWVTMEEFNQIIEEENGSQEAAE